MDFDRLRYLVAVARTGSVRGAAAALHVTSGAVSKALARLEEETSLVLLVPDGRGVSLTDDGAWLARKAEYLISEFSSLGSQVSSRKLADDEVSLATYDVFANWFPAELARVFLPGIPLSIAERWPGDVEAAVATGMSDVGITYIPVATEGVVHAEAARVQLGAYVQRDAFADVPFEELPFAVALHPVAGAVHQYGPLDGWPTSGPRRSVRFRTSSLEARLELCRHGQAAILLPKFVTVLNNRPLQRAFQLEERELPPTVGSLHRRVYVARRIASSEPLKKRVEVVAAALRTVCELDS